MKKIIFHISSRYSSFGTFNASKRIFRIFNNHNIKNFYLTGRIDDNDFKKDHVKLLNIENNLFFYKLNYLVEKFLNFLIQKKKTKLYWSHSLFNFSILDKITKINKAEIIFL